MARITKRTSLVILAPLILVAMATAQTQRPRLTLSAQGYPGDAPVVQLQGRSYVEMQDLARITNGSLTFEKDRTILTVPGCDGSKTDGADAAKSGFSRSFMGAAIEAMASIREWGGILQATVQDRYPVGNAMTGNTIIAHQERAADRVALASAAASTDSDYRGLELLRNEFNNLQAWTDRFVQSRKSLTAQYMTLSEIPFQEDEQAQKIMRCGQFLAQMFPGGTFQDDAMCH